MLDTTQNWPWIINCSQLPKISQNISKSLACHRFQGVFYSRLSFYTLDLWPCQPWSTIEACHVVDLISKRNKLWKIFRDSLKIRNISNLYLHCTEQPPQYWCYLPLYRRHLSTVLKVFPLYRIPSTVLIISLLYWCYPPSTDVIPHCTKQPPQYWSYPPKVLLLSPTVLKVSFHSSDVIPHGIDVISLNVLMLFPTLLKLSPTVLSNLHSIECIHPQYWGYPPSTDAIPRCTKQPPQYWTDVIWGCNVRSNYDQRFRKLDTITAHISKINKIPL